jgi:hypothetical protein
MLLTGGQRGDSPRFIHVLAGIRVPRRAGGRPRTRPYREPMSDPTGFSATPGSRPDQLEVFTADGTAWTLTFNTRFPSTNPIFWWRW